MRTGAEAPAHPTLIVEAPMSTTRLRHAGVPTMDGCAEAERESEEEGGVQVEGGEEEGTAGGTAAAGTIGSCEARGGDLIVTVAIT